MLLVLEQTEKIKIEICHLAPKFLRKRAKLITSGCSRGSDRTIFGRTIKTETCPYRAHVANAFLF
jgi:hypothetical protein